MFALLFRFPAGHYHATPWGRHVNEGAVAWPPEPYRILRALIATWYRTADRERHGAAALARVIDALASELPLFGLPDAVHAHTRHYMPQGKLAKGREDTKLVFDAFLRVSPDDELVVVWPQTSLPVEGFEVVEHLAERVNYFGRAESLVCARTERDLDWEPRINSRPEGAADMGFVAVDILAPLSPQAYDGKRPELLMLNTDRATSKARQAFEATLPPTLFEALQVETSSLQAVGWSQPPAGRVVLYGRREIGPRPPARRARPASAATLPKIARLVLAGRPPPRIEEAVKIGEVFRRAVMAHVKGEIPAVLSGREPDGSQLQDPLHGHAFFLPEDHDHDGFIDHLVLYIRDGLPSSVMTALDQIRRLWIADRRSGGAEEDLDEGRKEWRLALEGFGEPSEFTDCALLRRSKVWENVTPYLRPWHVKSADILAETQAMIKKECRLRGLPACEAEPAHGDGRYRDGGYIVVGSNPRSVLHFHRFRSRRGLIQPDRSGTALRLTFADPVCGPIALGFGCHFGLGLFRAVQT
jgi:CRISPR-associated protein Csb2